MLSVGSDLEDSCSYWTLMAGRVTMPRDATRLQLHLTTNSKTGTVAHDAMVLFETLPGEFVRVEGRPMRADSSVRMGQVNAVRKVFPDDPEANAYLDRPRRKPHQLPETV